MSREMPLVSVIVPVYNVKDYLPKCVDSIVKQSYKNIEIILVDDESTDGSEELADKYEKEYKNIKTVHRKNGGLSCARNTGIANAKGEWLTFVDSDDYVHEKFIETLYNLAVQEDADIATCSFEPFTDDGSMLKKSPTWPSQTFSGQEAVDDMLKNKRPAYACLNLVRAELFKKNNIQFPEGKEFEDMAPKVKLLSNAKKVAYTNKKLYYYLIRKSSITGKPLTEQRCSDFMFALNDIEDYLNHEKKDMGFKYINYYKFDSMTTLMNYLARGKNNKNSKVLWKRIRTNLKKEYKKALFPTKKKKILGKSLLMLSAVKPIYVMMYRMVKK